MPNTAAHPFASTRPAAAPALIGAFLLLALFLTRPQPFAAWSHLPDATVAVFLLAGCYLRRHLLFVLFFSLAVLIDTLVVRLAEPGGHCITAAYCFLLPAYAAPWYLGRILAAGNGPPAVRPLWLLCPLPAGLLAFLCSDGGFYFWSGHSHGGLPEYLPRLGRLAPDYLTAVWGSSLLLGLATEYLRRAAGTSRS